MSKDIESTLSELRFNRASENAWKEFHKYFRAKIVVQLLRLGLRDTWSLEDISQQAFLKFLHYSPWKQGGRELPSLGILSAYFATTTRNLFYDYLRKNQTNFQDVDIDSLSGTTEESVVNEAFQKWFDSLEPIDKSLVIHRLEGLSLSESAERLNLTYSVAGTRLHRLKKKLKTIQRDV